MSHSSSDVNVNEVVGVSRIAKVVIRDAHPPALQQGHQGAKPIARGLPVPREDQGLDLGGHR